MGENRRRGCLCALVSLAFAAACESAEIEERDMGRGAPADAGSPDDAGSLDDGGSLDAGARDAGRDAAERDARVADSAPELRDAAPSYAVVAGDFQTLDPAGSSGGGITAIDAGCAIDAVGTALSTWLPDPASGQTQVSAVALTCRPVRSDGSLGSPTVGRMRGTGTVMTTDECATGEVVVGLHGHVTAWDATAVVGRLGVSCAPLDRWVGRDPSSRRELPERGTYMMDAGAGFSTVCDLGYVLDRLDGRLGAALDTIQGRCVRVTR